MILSTNMIRIREMVKILKISTNGLEIEVKKKDYTIADVKDIILFL